MRALWMCVALAGCTPDIVSGAYVCGPDAACPEGQACNGTEDQPAGLIAETCVLESLAREFVCTPSMNFEPDDSAAQGHLVQLDCVSVQLTIQNCMAAEDPSDWLTFVAPSVCTAVAVEGRLTFPISYERLALELWDVDANMKIADDEECLQGADERLERRCLDVTLTPGAKYGVKVKPTGEGNCSGDCAYNRYTLNVQLVTPG